MQKNILNLISIVSVITIAQPLLGMNFNEIGTYQEKNSSLKRILELDLDTETQEQQRIKRTLQCPVCLLPHDNPFALNEHARMCYQNTTQQEILSPTEMPNTIILNPTAKQKKLKIIPYTMNHYLKQKDQKFSLFTSYEPKTLSCKFCKKAYAHQEDLQIHIHYACTKNKTEKN